MVKLLIRSTLFTYSFFLLPFLFSCESEEKTKQKEELVEIKNGIYTEYYPGKKALKFKGPVDDKKNRNGRWSFYTENGTETSTCEYANGKKHGMTVVLYPNGAKRYIGQYDMDKEIGKWDFYRLDGSLEKTVNYDSINSLVQ